MLTTRFPPDYGGGARLALKLSQKLMERGVSVTVFSGHKKQETLCETLQGIPITRIPLPDTDWRSLISFYARLMGALWKARGSFDVLHAHAIHHHAYAGFLIGKILEKPTLAKISLLGHDDPASIRKRRLGRIQTILLRQATTLVAVSQEISRAATATGWPSARLVPIPNGVDTDHFQPPTPESKESARRKLCLADADFVGVFVGGVMFRKGLHTLFKAWLKVKRIWPHAILLIVGPCDKRSHWGIDESYVEELRHTLETEDAIGSVRFVGQVEDPKLALQASDLFLLPSHSEGMPNALLEAMACGLPFVATRLGVIEELASDKQRCYLIPIDDDLQLADSIMKLAAQRELRQILGEQARRKVETHYSLNAISDRYVSLYQSLVHQHRL